MQLQFVNAGAKNCRKEGIESGLILGEGRFSYVIITHCNTSYTTIYCHIVLFKG